MPNQYVSEYAEVFSSSLTHHGEVMQSVKRFEYPMEYGSTLSIKLWSVDPQTGDVVSLQLDIEFFLDTITQVMVSWFLNDQLHREDGPAFSVIGNDVVAETYFRHGAPVKHGC